MKDTTFVPLSTELLVELVNRYQERYHVVLGYIIEDFLKHTKDQAIPSDGSD